MGLCDVWLGDSRQSQFLQTYLRYGSDLSGNVMCCIVMLCFVRYDKVTLTTTFTSIFTGRKGCEMYCTVGYSAV